MTGFFLQRYRKIRPDVTMNAQPLKALRVNTNRTTNEKLVRTLTRRGVSLERIPWLRHGYYATADFSLGSTKEYLLGWYYLQAPLSQLACEMLNPTGDVLDMAAAPGGKTTYLAQMTDGIVVALDTHPARLAAVRNNVERLGLTNVICVKKDARFASDLNRRFPFVLLDAPCSGNFCSEDEWVEKRTLEGIRANARVQKELLRAAYACLAPGGSLVYSTCSLEPEEDECVISWFLHKYEDTSAVELPTAVGEPGTTSWDGRSLHHGVGRTRRFWPHRTGCEGFYIALLRKEGG